MFKSFQRLHPAIRYLLDSAILITAVTIIFQSGAVYNQVQKNDKDISSLSVTMQEMLVHVSAMDATMQEMNKRDRDKR